MIYNTYQKFFVRQFSLFLNERTKSLLIFPNVRSIKRAKLLFFFGCVVVSDLYLFQETVLLIPCFMFSKNLMLWFIDQVTTGTLSASNHKIYSCYLIIIF